MICANCELHSHHFTGYIKIIEHFGTEFDDEEYYFCSYACLMRWYK